MRDGGKTVGEGMTDCVTVYSEGAGQQPVTDGGWWVQIRQNRECDGVIEISKMIVRSCKGSSDWCL